MIGIFDSGLGGLTVLKPLREQLPHHDVVYLADQAHVPYGDRDPAELVLFLRHNLEYLHAAGAEVIVVACNTSCAVAASEGWPASAAPLLDLIEVAADSIAAAGARKIAVLATTATTRSGAYGNAIRARVPDAKVEEIAAPALVPLVEAGTTVGRAAHAAVADVCALLPEGIDTVVYGCSHYPVLDALFAEILPSGVRRLDPAIAQAEAAEKLVAELQIAPGAGMTRYVTTGSTASLAVAIRAYLGESDPMVVSAAEILTKTGNA